MIEIIADKEPRLYELTYLLPTNLTDSELSKAKEAVVALIKKHQGQVVHEEDWSKRKLAYRIRHAGQKQAEAVYTFLIISFLPDQVQAFEKELKMSELVMRHLLVSSEYEEAAEIAPSENSLGEVGADSPAESGDQN